MTPDCRMDDSVRRRARPDEPSDATMSLRSTLAALAWGAVATLATLLLAPVWWPHFWLPYLLATALLYAPCKSASGNPIATGLVACLPGLLIPVYTWWLVLLTWEPVAEARAAGGMYSVFCLGDPRDASTKVLFLVFPAILVLASGLSAGMLAKVVGRRRTTAKANEPQAPEGRKP